MNSESGFLSGVGRFIGSIAPTGWIAIGLVALLIAGPAATKANRPILQGKTVGQFLNWLHQKTGEWAR